MQARHKRCITVSDDALKNVKGPTLLIVGGLDTPVLELNEDAFADLGCNEKLCIVPGATHLFEETGKLEEVARLATDCFKQHLRPCQ